MSIPLTAWSQSTDGKKVTPYSSLLSLDWQLGVVYNAKNYNQLPDAGMSVFGHGDPGCVMSLKTTGFVSRHWGAYMEWDFQNNTIEDDLIGRQLSRKYELDVVDWGTGDYCVDNINSDKSITLMFGAVYRLDYGKLSLRPRLGLGVRSKKFRKAYIFSDSYNVQYSEKISYDYTFYMENSDQMSRYSYRAFAYSPGVQLCLIPRHRMYFSLDISWMGTIGHGYQVNEAKYMQYTLKETSEESMYWDVVYSSLQKTRTRVSMGNFPSFRLGIGWNFGNR